MKFKHSFLYNYLQEAPIPLAFERAFECEILSKQNFSRPILDIGCGDGIFAKILFDEKIDTGLDPLAHELESAKKYDLYNELIEAFANKIPVQNETFKTIFSNSVLEHIPDLEPVLKEINRVLSKDGNFLITIPTNYFDNYSMIYQTFSFLGLNKFAQSYQVFFNNFWKHYHYYKREDWIKLFEKNGFKVKNIIEYGTKSDCLFNDFMLPNTFPNFLVKKILNRFFLIKSLRKIYSPIIYLFLRKKVKLYPNLNTGGLIFFELIK